jgi:hypothetical protein
MSLGSSMRRIGVVKARGMRLVIGSRDTGIVVTDFNTYGAEGAYILRSRPSRSAPPPGKPPPDWAVLTH